ncbi:MAG: hypothetical protein ACO1OQ_03005 [Rufibacter sp.]
MRLKRIIPLGLFLAFALMVFAGNVALNYPKNWNSINIGMSRSNMVNQLGKSLTDGMHEIKGDVYIEDFTLGWYRADLFTDQSNGKISDKSIHLYLGTKTYFYRLTV